MSDTPRVFLTDLHAYNSGTLHGKWVDATDEDELNEAVREILASSPHPGGEEWFITDYDNFEGYQVGEYERLGLVATVGAAIEEHGAAVALWLNNEAGNFENLDSFSDYFISEVESEKAYEKDMYDELVLEVFKAGLRELEGHEYRPHLLKMFENSIEDYIDVDRASNGIAQDVTFLVGSDGTTYAFRDEP